MSTGRAVTLEVQSNNDTLTQETTTKRANLKVALFVFNVICFASDMLFLLLSFNEIITECITVNCNPSASDYYQNICLVEGVWPSSGSGYGDYGAYDCVSVDYEGCACDPYGPIAECNVYIPDYGCGCYIFDYIYDRPSIGEYCSAFTLNDTSDKCQNYSCKQLCRDFCVKCKYVAFILVVIFEFFGNIPLFETTQFEEKMKVKNSKTSCIYLRCCGATKAKIWIKMMQYISNWMTNFVLYSTRGAPLGMPHLDWVIVGMLLFLILLSFKYWSSKNDSTEGKCKNACEFMDFIAKGVLPNFAYVYFFFCGFIFAYNMNLVVLSFQVVFHFDFKTKLWIGMHTISLLINQFVAVLRLLLQCDCV